MKNLMAFEGNKVEMLTVDGVLLFEVYSVGMALGHYRWNGKRTSCTPNKQRIDKNLESADIKPCVRNAHKYITESQLYDLMLEVKTEKVKPFRKWVVNEVIPSIMKTGEYKITQGEQLKLEEPYTYTPKYYKGEEVVILKDLEYFTKLPYHVLRCCLQRKAFKKGTDYFFLENSELAEFKKNNQGIKTFTNHLIVVTKSGFLKLAKILKQPKDLIEFKALEPAKAVEPVSVLKTDKPLIEKIRNELHALDTMLENFNRYDCCSAKGQTVKVLQNMGFSISDNISNFARQTMVN